MLEVNFMSHAFLPQGHVAYVSGGGKQIAFVLTELFSFPLSNYIGYFLFSTILCIILFLRKQIVENINAFLFTIMIIAFVLLVYSCPCGERA